MKKIILLFGLLVTCWQINAQYCTPTISVGCVDDEIDDFTIPNAGFSHLSSGCSANSYGDFTADATLEIDLLAGIAYNFQIVHGYGNQHVKIWIDFNSNQTFDDTEVVFTSTTGSIQTDGSITIPASATQGATRMRVVDIWGQEPSDPCTPSGTGVKLTTIQSISYHHHHVPCQLMWL
ncbi:GEVED domain-containing protein [Flavobacterium sp. CS20]|uniref:GEVED domain-containing protein n=1 Tax=Flavobacterium sp. CS20 TaxID=2775246 RepID=UPI001B39D213|nr:GEVED domain-containing protein [Flavobacterium sp. CS20]QTY28001.1 hypothetical protein IGB25_05775 [Flavobacterium sp. CS20]